MGYRDRKSGYGRQVEEEYIDIDDILTSPSSTDVKNKGIGL